MIKNYRVMEIYIAGAWFKEGQWSFCLFPYISYEYNRPSHYVHAGWLFWSVSLYLGG